MPRTLIRFLLVHHLKYYCLMAAVLASVAAMTIRTPNTAFIVLVPLSLVSSLSVTAIVFELAFRRELETLQAYGVSLRTIATPLITVVSIPMGSTYVITVPFAKDIWFAAALGVVTIAALALYFVVLFSGIRTSGDAGTAAACVRATLVQAGSIAFAWMLLALLRV